MFSVQSQTADGNVPSNNLRDEIREETWANGTAELDRDRKLFRVTIYKSDSLKQN